jgi:Na+/H+ antiporter NhaC
MCAVVLLVALGSCGSSLDVHSAAAGDTASVTAGDPATTATAAAPESYGGWVLAPALAAIVCAILTRQVTPSLLLGILVGAFMMFRLDAAAVSISGAALGSLRMAVEHYVIGALIDENHLKVMVFTLVIGGMVGAVEASGGTAAMVELVARRASTRCRGQLTAWVAGLLVFFDDYANCMIIGPTLQPVFDRLRISRAKLAYIIDSTAAPVASIALVGTWVGAELGYIQEGLTDVASHGAPAFLANVSAWQVFVSSLPYRFYAVLAIILVLLVAVTDRDIGPMRRHEARAVSSASERAASPTSDRAKAACTGHWGLAAVPIGVLVVVTGLVLLWPGYDAMRAAKQAGEPFTATQFFDSADSYNAILYGALASLTVAIALAVAARRSSLHESMDAMMNGMARVFPAIVVLTLAWALSAVAGDLHVGQVVSGWLSEEGFSIRWLPLAVFVSAAGVSFATGTSWGTMGILCPIVVRVAADLGAATPPDEALPLFYASVGGVLAGSIFGDHCSPISDTTVLSAIASGCSLEDHVWTQMPYALITAGVSMLAGEVLCGELGFSPWVGLAAGVALLWVVLRLMGRRIDWSRRS